jgi:peptide-methionine (S)-S-oxide reductase
MKKIFHGIRLGIRKTRPGLLLTAVIPLAILGARVSTSSAEEVHAIPAAVVDEPVNPQATSETAVLAGGCFWGVQGVFQHVAGVTNAVSGYTGGGKLTAHYEIVSTGTTGHAESVRITFDPRRISYGRILQIYFSVAHDPTELNAQGPDEGTQYRSAIFPLNAQQAQVAQAYIAQLTKAHVFSEPIVTKIEPNQTFYPAEAHHQNFLANNPDYPYIVINDLPKIDHLKQIYPAMYRPTPVLVEAAAQ